MADGGTAVSKVICQWMACSLGVDGGVSGNVDTVDLFTDHHSLRSNHKEFCYFEDLVVTVFLFSSVKRRVPSTSQSVEVSSRLGFMVFGNCVSR